MYEIRTTCKPSAKLSDFLFHNQIIKQAIDQSLPTKIYNKMHEIPKELLDYEFIKIISDFTEERPSIAKMLSKVNSNYILLCNADIFFEETINEKIKILEKNFPISFLGRRFDVHKEIRFEPNLDNSLNKIHGYLQSSRTIDYFLISSEACNHLKNIRSLYLGTVGIDIKIISILNRLYNAADATDYITVFHPNHENFRTIFKTSILYNHTRNTVFTEKRKNLNFSSSKKIINGDLSYCHYRLSSSGVIKSGYYFKKLHYFLEKIVSLSSNKIEYFCYKINKFMFDRLLLKLRLIVISRKFKIIIFLPKMKKSSLKYFEEEAVECVKKQINKVKNEKIKRINCQ